MLARKHLLGIQRAMYQRLRASASVYFGRLSPELERYFLEYGREFHRFGVVTTKEALLSSLLQSQIALCGDYHTLSQAQRSARETLDALLPELKKQGRSAVLALEMLPFARTAEAERYLAGTLGEGAFLKAIGFRQSWGFEWKNYRELFRFAAENGIRVVGLNGPSVKGASSVRARDRFAARVLSDLSAENSDTFVFALIGDLHLAAQHLPGDLNRALAWKGLRRKVVTLHQNQEDLYWKLAERGLEETTEVVKMREGVFCLMNTPPWLKLQSLVRWEEAGGKHNPDPIDFAEELVEVLDVLQSFLGMEEPVDPDFRICGPKDVSWLARRRSREGLGKTVLLESIGKFEGHFVPGENLIFLADYGLPAIASQAALLLHFQLSGFQKEFLSPRRDFYSFVWTEALAFLGSKVIFPRRVPELPRARPPRLPATCRSARGILGYYAQAKAVGAVLGDALFHAVVKGDVERDMLRSLFENPFSDPQKTKALYLQWTRRLSKSSP